MLNKCIHSAYWHRFAATVHSPVGLNPNEYGIRLQPNKKVKFAENEVAFVDPTATNHDMLDLGLKKALYNYMHNMGFEYPVPFWFETQVVETSLAKNTIKKYLD
jgi:hypothetical protein